ncbi:hypothetical protein V6N13_073110 [Hibiscus sabdariffa]
MHSSTLRRLGRSVDATIGLTNASLVIAEDIRTVVESKYDPILKHIQESDRDWLKKCLIGQISAMYDAEIVQQFLYFSDGSSDGFCSSPGIGGNGVNFGEFPQTWDNVEELMALQLQDIYDREEGSLP